MYDCSFNDMPNYSHGLSNNIKLIIYNKIVTHKKSYKNQLDESDF